MQLRLDLFNYSHQYNGLLERQAGELVNALVSDLKRSRSISTSDQFLVSYMGVVLEMKPHLLDRDDRALGEIVYRTIDLLFLMNVWRNLEVAIELLKNPEGIFSVSDFPQLRLNRYKELEGESIKLIISVSLTSAARWLAFVLSLREIKADKRNIENIAAKGGRASSERWEMAKKMAKEIAFDRWADADAEDEVVRIGVVAKDILSAISADLTSLGLNRNPDVNIIKKWISDVAPDEARKSGRPKKK